ncbi:uncharacterized protein FIBRA_00951 [Fibroporia radiculosa]|uniref:C2H2-type domain-containing protein n=1 Tax=Fibroporia radiculosa TaxID=599839 RepID=J4H0U2_9APHY|nr:uncharacterized protein FIBRA_00951 [Fibroporia radiculosa]CCL98944.1 predicted protein [Fibroporia radiculosa]
MPRIYITSISHARVPIGDPQQYVLLLLPNTATMQSHLPSASHPPRNSPFSHLYSQAFAYDTSFFRGSPPSAHAMHSPGHSTHSANATGPSASAPARYSYPYSASVLQAPFRTYTAWDPSYPHKSLPSSSAAAQPSPPMAISYSTTQSASVPETAAETASSQDAPANVDARVECPQEPPQDVQPEDTSSEKKKHPCWMCHKRFDRPSTLRKHLLVHTGEKAFSCDICGRRFGVQSNLTRHAKRCAQRPMNIAMSRAAASAAASSTSADAASGENATDAGPPPDEPLASTSSAPVPAPSRTRKRARGTSPAAGDTRSPPSADNVAPSSSSKGKRVRRAPSPSRWVPDSLRLYDLTLPSKGTPVPLPPVRPFRDTNGDPIEERNSFDENASATPYLTGWQGRLPGPGIMDKDVANTNGGRLFFF